MTMSDRVVILDGGELQQVGTPETVYNEPMNRFVADFIGSPSMNFFEVRQEERRLVGDAFEYPLSDELIDRLSSETDQLTLGIRPENIRISETPTDRSISASVVVVEPVGSDNYVYLTIGDDECTVRVPAHVKPEEHDDVELVFDEKHMHLFDRNNGDNLLVQQRQVAPSA